MRGTVFAIVSQAYLSPQSIKTKAIKNYGALVGGHSSVVSGRAYRLHFLAYLLRENHNLCWARRGEKVWISQIPSSVEVCPWLISFGVGEFPFLYVMLHLSQFCHSSPVRWSTRQRCQCHISAGCLLMVVSCLRSWVTVWSGPACSLVQKVLGFSMFLTRCTNPSVLASQPLGNYFIVQELLFGEASVWIIAAFQGKSLMWKCLADRWSLRNR